MGSYIFSSGVFPLAVGRAFAYSAFTWVLAVAVGGVRPKPSNAKLIERVLREVDGFEVSLRLDLLLDFDAVGIVGNPFAKFVPETVVIGDTAAGRAGTSVVEFF